MIFAVLLDGAEPHGVLLARNTIEQQRKCGLVHGIYNVVRVHQLRDVEVVHQPGPTALRRRFVRPGINAHEARLRHMHDRGSKIIGALPIPTPQAPNNGRMDALAGDVTPIFVGETRRIFLAVAEKRPQRPRKRQQAHQRAARNVRKRHHALRVRLIGPRLLFFQHRVQALLARMQAKGLQRDVRQPRRGNQHAHFRIFARLHARHRASDRPVLVHRHHALKRSMTPCAHVFARLDAHALRHRQLQRSRHVFRWSRPLRTQVLPVHLGNIVVHLGHVRDGVIKFDHHFAWLVPEEHVHGILRRIYGICILVRAAFFAPFQLERHF